MRCFVNIYVALTQKKKKKVMKIEMKWYHDTRLGK